MAQAPALQAAVDQFCRACEPGVVCRMPACRLHPLSLPGAAVRLAEALSQAHMAFGDAPYIEPPYIEPLGDEAHGLRVPEAVNGVMIAPAGLVLARRKLSFFHIVAILERLITGYGRAIANRGPHVLYWMRGGHRQVAPGGTKSQSSYR